MKQKLIAALVTSAIAGLAATSANAGVIQATYKIYAAEVFGDTSLALTVPTVSYNLSRPISGTVANPNNFTITLTLSAGEWAVAPNAQLRDPSNVLILNGAAGVISGDKKSVSFAFTANDGNTYPVNSTITFGNVTIGTVTKVDSILKTPLDNACSPTQAEIAASVKMTNASGVEVDTNDPGAIVATPVLASNVALRVSATSSASYDGTTATNNELSKVNVLSPDFGTKFTNAAGDITDASKLLLNIGRIDISDRASLFDSDGGNKYSVVDVDFATDAAADGGVSAKTLNAVITGKFGTATGFSAALFTDTACTVPVGGAGGVATINGAGDTATFATTVALADWALTGTTRSAYVCYTVPGTKTIPTAQFKLASGSLTKGSASKELANPVCPAGLYNLASNGVQIDVRNYIQKAQTDASGWTDVVRFINTDETQSAVISAQLIKDDGSLLAAGEVLTLAPRAFKYLTNAEIEAALPATVGASGNNARLRVTSASSSLRVQNYHVNPITGAVTENSAAQGDEGYAAAANAQNTDVPLQNNK